MKQTRLRTNPPKKYIRKETHSMKDTLLEMLKETYYNTELSVKFNSFDEFYHKFIIEGDSEARRIVKETTLKEENK